jgi:integrase
VFHRKDGYWVAQIELEDGKRKQYYLKTQKEAVELLRKAQREVEQGTIITAPHQTVEQYLTYWLEEVHKPTIRVSTYVKYRKLIHTYIIPSLGRLRLDKLTPQQVKSLYNQKEHDGLSAKTITAIHGVLHEALDNAVRWHIVTRNVCDVVNCSRCAGQISIPSAKRSGFIAPLIISPSMAMLKPNQKLPPEDEHCSFLRL